LKRAPGSWHHHRAKAEFEAFLWRDAAGRAHFRSQTLAVGKRFRERTWPVFWRIRKPRRKIDAWEKRHMPLWYIPYERLLERKLRLEVARRWWIVAPLMRQWDRVDEAIEASRGTLA
jgi:hypothetical protein